MKTLSNRALRLWLTLFVLGCGSDPIVQEPQPFKEFRYPMELGNKWRYSQTYSVADTAAGAAWRVTESGTVTTEVAGIYAWGPLNKFRVEMQYVTTDRDTFNSTDWYLHSASGLYSYAYENAGGGIANPAPGQRHYVIAGKTFSSMGECIRYFTEGKRPVRDEIYYEDPPKQTYAYPLEVGAKWIFRGYDDPFWMQKTCIREETIATATDSYDCMVIKIEYDLDENFRPDTDIIYYEWVAAEGLVKRQFMGEGQVWDEGHNNVNYMQFKQELILLSFHKPVITPFE